MCCLHRRSLVAKFQLQDEVHPTLFSESSLVKCGAGVVGLDLDNLISKQVAARYFKSEGSGSHLKGQPPPIALRGQGLIS